MEFVPECGSCRREDVYGLVCMACRIPTCEECYYMTNVSGDFNCIHCLFENHLHFSSFQPYVRHVYDDVEYVSSHPLATAAVSTFAATTTSASSHPSSSPASASDTTTYGDVVQLVASPHRSRTRAAGQGEKGGKRTDAPEECPICLEDTVKDWTWLPCAHAFHYECFQTLVKFSANKKKVPCPICRTNHRFA